MPTEGRLILVPVSILLRHFAYCILPVDVNVDLWGMHQSQRQCVLFPATRYSINIAVWGIHRSQRQKVKKVHPERSQCIFFLSLMTLHLKSAQVAVAVVTYCQDLAARAPPYIMPFGRYDASSPVLDAVRALVPAGRTVLWSSPYRCELR